MNPFYHYITKQPYCPSGTYCVLCVVFFLRFYTSNVLQKSNVFASGNISKYILYLLCHHVCLYWDLTLMLSDSLSIWLSISVLKVHFKLDTAGHKMRDRIKRHYKTNPLAACLDIFQAICLLCTSPLFFILTVQALAAFPWMTSVHLNYRVE